MQQVFNQDLFVGQTVLVSGGGSGIGLAIARCFGELGARLVIVARDRDRLEQAATELRDQGMEVLCRAVNIRDADSVSELFDGLTEQGICPDLLVNNAGGQFTAPALDISPNGFRSVVDLNLQGTFQMSQAYARCCQTAGKGGNIVNIVLCLEQGIPGMAHAAASRAGVVNLTRTLAWEWAELGIRVNAVAPGTIETDGLDNYDADNLQQGIDQLLIKRMGSPAEVAQTVAFLASPAASYITGICLAQDGGEHLTGASPQR
ncbi:SDR family oxidoreductase [Amphritea sp. HPY]|uniref:SDR family oxidoreductase n=1 Tax=Amphritea sp. HPY TaxID=3421652 RepID=UPI003D7E17BF